jgi:hypothetical protein
MSITAIARQAQGIRAGKVIAKLAEDTYFMRVDNRVNQPPPARNRDNEATSRSADLGVTVLEPSCRLSPTVLVQTPADPHKLATVAQLLPAIVRSFPTATLGRRQRRRKLQPWGQQEGQWRRQSRRPRPHEQPRLRSLTGRLRRPPED